MKLLPKNGDWFDRNQGKVLLLLLAVCILACIIAPPPLELLN